MNRSDGRSRIVILGIPLAFAAVRLSHGSSTEGESYGGRKCDQGFPTAPVRFDHLRLDQHVRISWLMFSATKLEIGRRLAITIKFTFRSNFTKV
jgi:hypothetical protein